ncbi:hypothetical protein SteCoe_24758 [Stentor coeruleus]|uniref:Piwi-like protein 12 n=1 Tax=Stentor coeruleus TaxID=5963 RepID=A0A060BK66_9CILI|nr:piwi-like protein 12 [Stentor coeruleus]OMJ75996.1 hypothetical protein SteCoe_24758 [Stentor coeruleus]
MVDRPGTQGGSNVVVTTNFFRLKKSPVNNVTVYSISFTPDIDAENRALRTGLLIKGKAQVEAQIGKYIKTGNVLYSKTAKREPFSVNVQSNENEQFIIVVTPVGTVTGANVDSYRMYANSALKKMLSSLDLKQVTRMPKFYDIRQTQRVDQLNLEVWRGYTATFSHHLQDMLLNLDFSSKIIRDTTALQYIEEIKNNTRGGNLEQIVNSEMVGMIVMAKYGNFKCYRIERVVLNENATGTFPTREGPISYSDYFKKRYDIVLRTPRQPLLVTFIEKGTKEIRLIPELCALTGISEDMRRDFRAMNDIAAYTRLEPANRLRVSTDLATRLANDNKCKAICEEYNMQIDQAPIQVNGIRLPMEGIKVGPNNSDIIQIDQRGGFNLRSSIVSAVPIERWVVLTTDRDAQNRDRLIKTLVNKGSQLGIRMGQAIQMDYQPRNLKNIISSLNQPQGGRPVPQIALIVVSPNDKKGYNDIKEACALISGIPTQCLKANNLNNPKKFDSIMSKLVVQMAVKTGSIAWQVAPTAGLPQKTMVIGIDVFHDTVLRAKSVLGFVASIHPAFTSYFNTTRIHQSVGQEIGGHVGECLREALLAFFEATKKRFMPELIIVYRDGVADSQIDAAKKFEVEAMKNTIKSFQGYSPNLVYVLVNKKTNAKLFVQGQRGMDNPQPGTVVNSVVIPESQSFYLIAHAVTQGMASPTLYRIIHNDNNTDTMIVARLAFKLCYMYYNWTGGIKVPAPTMMAHKLAYLVGQSVHATHVEALRTLPWFY